MRQTTDTLIRDPRPERPGAGAVRLLREDVSRAGRRIRLARHQGTHDGAQPYYTVAYDVRDDRRPQRQPLARVSRYTPFLDRAEILFERFRHDITDPALLAAQELAG